MTPDQEKSERLVLIARQRRAIAKYEKMTDEDEPNREQLLAAARRDLVRLSNNEPLPPTPRDQK